MNFGAIKSAVADQFQRMQGHQLFRVEVDKDTLWSTYLGSFPDGMNPVYRERTEHDCSCCRQFIRAVGDVVAVIDGELVSIWDVHVPTESAYEAVTAALSALVKSKPILAPFLYYEGVAGTDRNFEQMTEGVKTWTHFYVNLQGRFVKPKASIPSLLSESRSQHDVFLRSLREISPESIATALELIAQNSLYRGEEHGGLIAQFQAVKREFDALPADRQDLFAWTSSGAGAMARIRNTAIGTLLVDLSEGMDLEAAVRSFESKVAPTNYKRPTTLVTKAMVERAKEKLAELGLLSALDRRYATLRDINVNDVLFADRTTRRTITGDAFDELAATGGHGIKNLDRVEEVPIERFLADVLPRAESLEVMFENRHRGNLVSLIAPCDPTARHLFKWNNNFSWSYQGDLADAIKERVKQAGGNVTGDLCCRLAWFNYDDLDYHMVEPDGNEISFMSRVSRRSGGMLDVDMNAGGPRSREPVENIFYGDRSRMQEGDYHLFVHQYSRREAEGIGFECAIDYLGEVHRFAYDKAVKQGERITVAKFRYTHKSGFKIIESLPSSQSIRTEWGIPTQTFHRVEALMLSPNHWGDEAIGNRHFFFMLEGCRNDGSARGFFNEFLRESLTPHRKVFEMVGAKMKPAEAVEQLSGMGFSSTRRDYVVCRVNGSFSRTIKIMF